MLIRDSLFAFIASIVAVAATYFVRLWILQQNYLEYMFELGGIRQTCEAYTAGNTIAGIMSPYPAEFLAHCFDVSFASVFGEYAILIAMFLIPMTLILFVSRDNRKKRDAEKMAL